MIGIRPNSASPMLNEPDPVSDARSNSPPPFQSHRTTPGSLEGVPKLLLIASFEPLECHLRLKSRFLLAGWQINQSPRRLQAPLPETRLEIGERYDLLIPADRESRLLQCDV